MKEILDFLAELAVNNNKIWFDENRSRYQLCRDRFIAFSTEYIRRLALLDPALAILQPKDCIWRINRDIRFSADKRPYKEWFGCFPAAGVAGGIWDPSKELLKALRTEIEANYEEVEQIMAAPQWKKYFAQDFDSYWGTGLKKVPAGFDPGFVHAEWLKHKMYTFSVPLTDEEVCAPDFIDHITDIAAAAKPMNDFLNYTFEEYGEFPSRCTR